MDNTYICKFINSKDIQKYLLDINYQFSVPEYAFLIWQNRELSIQHRHDAFKDLLKSTSSCLIKTSSCRDGWDLHEIISELVEIEDRMIQLFLKQEPNCFYTAEWVMNGYADWHAEGSYFTEYNKAYSYAMKRANNDIVGPSVRIAKHYIDNSESKSDLIVAIYNTFGDMIYIDTDAESFLNEHEIEILFERFDDMYFDIPIPFKPGDILCDRYRNNPFVITTTGPWYRKEHPPKKDKDTLYLTNMDMAASGYSVDEKNISVKFDWLDHYYLNLEYYTGDLSKEKRILLAYSLFEQKKITGDTLSKLIQLITAETQANRTYHNIDCMIDSETSRLLEIDKYKEKKHE